MAECADCHLRPAKKSHTLFCENMWTFCLFFRFSWSLLYGEAARLCGERLSGGVSRHCCHFTIGHMRTKRSKKSAHLRLMAIIMRLLAKCFGEMARLYGEAQVRLFRWLRRPQCYAPALL